MSKKKSAVNEERMLTKMKPKTCTVDGELYQKFELLCVLKNVKPKPQLENFIKDWIEGNAENLSANQLKKFILS